ncbi:sodium channel and clathrin linker 1 [Patella vulgata]|uniref:sodium channel and clathrin linker 1 n=1 Tax=Patella vulgata TaxID=6465 RepID=UPI0024A942DA|nr:sodium channel and clathrin linker 1 [Patella vulgata]
MGSHEISFLRDQVQRLNAELAKYQRKYKTSLDQSFTEKSTSTPWLADQSILSPLLEEYDQIIKELQDENTLFKNELRELKGKAEDLVEENDRLVRELKETLQNQLSSNELNHVTVDGQPDSDQLLINLQQQLQLAIQEKDLAEERWRGASREIDRLERSLELEKESHQWRVVEQQANQVKHQYHQTASDFNTEVETLQAELRQTRAELTSSSLQVTELRRTVAELQQQLTWKDQETADAIFKEGVSDGQTSKLKIAIDDLRQKLSVATKKCEQLQQDKEILENRAGELQNRLLCTDDKEHDAVMKVRDAIQMAENAILEKDQAEILCGQKDEELEQLQEVVNKLINEAGVRTRQEVDLVRKQSNDRISKLTEELHTMEMDNAEKQSQLDRLIREKRSVESELEKIYKEGVVQGSKENMSYQDLNQRAITAERAKHDAELKLDSLQTTLKREKLNSEQLKSQMEVQFTQLKDRMVAMEMDLQTSNEECLKYQDEIDDLKKKVQSAIQEKESAQRKYYKELAIIDQEKQMKIRDYEVKVQSTEDTNRHAMSELRKILTAQQRMAARWKEECQTITKKFETKIQDLREDLNHKQKRNEEITALLRESQDKTTDAGKTLAEATRNIRRMEERIRESEMRASDATKKLARLTVKFRQMESERQSLLQELSRSQKELSRSTKGASFNNSVEFVSSHRSSNGHVNGVSKDVGQLGLEDLQSER